MTGNLRIKTPVMMQMEHTDCGAVALGIILAFHGCHVSHHELRRQCAVSRDGVSVGGLIKAAQQYHVTASIHKELPTPENYTYPMILFYNLKHFVVLEGFKGKKVYINDPSTGRRTVDHDTLKKEFSGIAIQLIPNTQFQYKVKEKKALKYLLPWVKKEKMHVSSLLLSTLVLTGLNLSTPIFSKYFIDHYNQPASAHYLSTLLVTISITLILQILIVYAQRKMIRTIERKSSQDMGRAFITRLMQLPLVFFTQRRVADLTQRLLSIDRLSEILSSSLSVAVVGLLQLILSVLLMLHYNILLTGLACSFLLLNFSFYYGSQQHRQQLARALKREYTFLNALTMNAVSMILHIKLKGPNSFLTPWKKQLEVYLHAQRQLANANSLIQSCTYLFVGVIQVLILGLGGFLVMNQGFSIGSLIAFNGLFLSLNELLLQIANLGNQYNQAQHDISKIHDVMDYLPIPKSNTLLKNPEVGNNSKGKIELIDVTFGYNRGAKPLFNMLNLTVEPLSKVAITGPSGSGKSTLANLILGLYQPWSGAILIDGIPLADLSLEERHSRMGLINQDPFFIQGSIKDNLCLWDTHYSESELLKAMQQACIADLVLNSKEGFNFQLTEGATNLSGGQRQRLEIARMLLRESKILILDEATSALDPICEDEIIKNIFKINSTHIWIAHRFTTIRNADTIFILKEGRLIESGSHQALINQKSAMYFDLFKMDLEKEVVL